MKLPFPRCLDPLLLTRKPTPRQAKRFAQSAVGAWVGREGRCHDGVGVMSKRFDKIREIVRRCKNRAASGQEEQDFTMINLERLSLSVTGKKYQKFFN